MTDSNVSVAVVDAVVDVTPEVSPVAILPPVTTVAEKPKRERRQRAPKVEEKRGRGRPNVYVGPLLALMIAMVKACHNSSLVRSVLTGLGTAGKPLTNEQKRTYKGWRTSLAESTGLDALKKPMTISLPMLGKYAKDAGVEMPLGKPSFLEAEKQIEKLGKFIEQKAKKASAKTDTVKAA